MKNGYEVKWIGEYNGNLDMEDFDPTGCVYYRKNFEYRWQACAFARKIKKKAEVFPAAWVQEYRLVPIDYYPFSEKEYIGEKEEFWSTRRA